MMKYESVKTNHNPNWPYIPDHPYTGYKITATQLAMTTEFPALTAWNML